MDLKSAEDEKRDESGAYLGSAHRNMFGVAIPMGYWDIIANGWMGTYGFNDETTKGGTE